MFQLAPVCTGMGSTISASIIYGESKNFLLSLTEHSVGGGSVVASSCHSGSSSWFGEMRNEEESKSDSRLFNASPGYPLFDCHSRGLSHPLHPFSAECCSCQQWDILPWYRFCLSHCGTSSAVYSGVFVFGESMRGQEVQHHHASVRQARQLW